jgi:HSP20 family protein
MNPSFIGGFTMLPSLTRRNPNSPFEALWDMRREVDRLFNGVTTTYENATWTLPAEVIETANEMTFRLDAPGLNREDIDLTVENNVLTVSGERKWEHEEGKPEGEYHIFERRYGRFERSFALPRRVDASRIDAHYENGVLTVTMPKLEAAKPRRIEVKPGQTPRSIETGK